MTGAGFMVLYILGCVMSYFSFIRLSSDKSAAAVTAGFWPVVWLMIILMVLADKLRGTK